jgi:hypothetical protein
MRIFLRILVFFLLLLSIAALVLGCMLFAKRELMKGRTQTLERYLVKVGRTIEENPPAAPEPKPDDLERDISPCKPEILETVEKAKFWTTYKYELEQQDQPTLNLGAPDKQRQLMTYYKTDPMGEVLKDPTTGYKITTGEGTMDALLSNTLFKCEEQLNRMNQTRQQLKDLRKELISTVTDLNDQKRQLRVALKTIEDLKAEIARLKAEIERLKQKIAELEQKIKELEDVIAAKNQEIVQLKEDIETKKADIVQLKKELEQYRKLIDELRGRERGGPGSELFRPPPGAKGKVTGVNGEWSFVVAEITDEFIVEVLGPKFDRPMEHAVISIVRKPEGKPEVFVTKARLSQIRKDKKVAIFDIMPEWSQKANMPIAVGDIIYAY